MRFTKCIMCKKEFLEGDEVAEIRFGLIVAKEATIEFDANEGGTTYHIHRDCYQPVERCLFEQS